MELAKVTLSSISTAADELRAQYYPRNETEREVYEALSSKNWGASTTLMNEIAADTMDYEKYSVVMKTIWATLDSAGRSWKQIFKALTLIEFLVKNGAERVIEDARDHMHAIRPLQDFNYYEGNVDKGSGLREKSKQLLELLSSNEMIRTERDKARRLRDKFTGVSSSGYGGESYGGGGSGNYSSGGIGSSSNSYSSGGIGSSYNDNSKFSDSGRKGYGGGSYDPNRPPKYGDNKTEHSSSFDKYRDNYKDKDDEHEEEEEKETKHTKTSKPKKSSSSTAGSGGKFKVTIRDKDTTSVPHTPAPAPAAAARVPEIDLFGGSNSTAPDYFAAPAPAPAAASFGFDAFGTSAPAFTQPAAFDPFATAPVPAAPAPVNFPPAVPVAPNFNAFNTPPTAVAPAVPVTQNFNAFNIPAIPVAPAAAPQYSTFVSFTQTGSSPLPNVVQSQIPVQQQFPVPSSVASGMFPSQPAAVPNAMAGINMGYNLPPNQMAGGAAPMGMNMGMGIPMQQAQTMTNKPTQPIANHGSSDHDFGDFEGAPQTKSQPNQSNKLLEMGAGLVDLSNLSLASGTEAAKDKNKSTSSYGYSNNNNTFAGLDGFSRSGGSSGSSMAAQTPIGMQQQQQQPRPMLMGSGGGMAMNMQMSGGVGGGVGYTPSVPLQQQQPYGVGPMGFGGMPYGMSPQLPLPPHGGGGAYMGQQPPPQQPSMMAGQYMGNMPQQSAYGQQPQHPIYGASPQGYPSQQNFGSGFK